VEPLEGERGADEAWTTLKPEERERERLRERASSRTLTFGLARC
jgi:hypothetical protein